MDLSKINTVLLVITLLCITNVQKSTADSNNVNIINGTVAKLHEFPYQIFLEYVNSKVGHNCGAILLNSSHVLTAAHCVEPALNSGTYTLIAGLHALNSDTDNSKQSRKVKAIKRHPKYNSDTLENDIALMEVDRVFELNINTVNGIKIAPSNYKASGSGTVSGWGLTRTGGTELSNLLMKTTVPILPTENCNVYASFNSETMICAGLKNGETGFCQGDSGGPLTTVYNGSKILIGIVSFSSHRGCAAPGIPDGYTNVAYYNEWIRFGSGSGSILKQLHFLHYLAFTMFTSKAVQLLQR